MYVDINLSYVHMHICSHVKLSHTDVAQVQIDLKKHLIFAPH